MKKAAFWVAVIGTWAGVGWAVWKPDPEVRSAAVHRHTAEEHWAMCALDQGSLQPGDLIVRAGKTFFSNELRKYNQRDKTYSHCGLITRGPDGNMQVIHSIGGTDNPDSRIKIDPISIFCHPEEITQFAIYRYEMDPEVLQRVDSLAHNLLDRRVPFDLKFDLADDSELYCAEFIYKVLSDATNDRNFISLTRFRDKLYVGVDDLFLNDHCTKIFEHAYH